jgi:hypothetical protein
LCAIVPSTETARKRVVEAAPVPCVPRVARACVPAKVVLVRAVVVAVAVASCVEATWTSFVEVTRVCACVEVTRIVVEAVGVASASSSVQRSAQPLAIEAACYSCV